MELAGALAFGHARVAGADRVDEDQVAVGEQAVFVVDQRVGRWRRVAHRVAGDALRAEDAQVQPDAARPRAAVEAEGDGPFACGSRIVGLQRVGGEEERGARLVGLRRALFRAVVRAVFGATAFGLSGPIRRVEVAQHQRAAGGAVLQCSAAHLELVVGDDEPLLRRGRRGRRCGA